MKKRHVRAVLIFIIFFGLFLAVRAPMGLAKVININHASGHSPTSIDVQIVKEWYAEVEKATEGRVKGTVYAGGALGKDPDMMRLVKSGSVGSGTLLGKAALFPVLDFMRYPFQFSGAAASSTALYYFYHKGYLDETLKGCKLMFMTGSAPFHLLTNKKITSMDDLKGLKIRVAASASAATIKGYGGTPVSFPPSEVYMAMEKGTVDGILTSMGLVQGFRLYEVIKHALWEPFGSGVLMNLMNLNVWNSISPEDRVKIEQINQKFAMRYTFMHASGELTGESFMQQHGVQINRLSDTEREKWKKVGESGARLEALKKYWEKSGLPVDKLLKEAFSMSQMVRGN